MLPRPFAFVVLAFAFTRLCVGQDIVVRGLPQQVVARIAPGSIESAWIDLRQVAPANSKPQTAPPWIQSVDVVATKPEAGTPARTVFRIRVDRPQEDLHVLMLRLFFDDRAEQRPKLLVWDETANQMLQSSELGNGVGLSTSETVIIPMTNGSAIDIEVPGDGTNVRGAYLDWMVDTQVLHPAGAAQRDLIPEPFAAAAPLHAPAQDMEQFGAVTATLADETILIGPSVQNGAAFQFGLETQPLVALITFEVGSPHVDSPPDVYLNGENLGAATLALPDLADPGYRGETGALVKQMRFQYTGWVRAQKLVPAASLRVGTNDLLVVGGSGTPATAIRATQIQLKYGWDKLDYQLVPDRPDGSR